MSKGNYSKDTLKQHFTTISGSIFFPPIGYISMFSGAWTDNVTIVGWYKCDGNNGTPDLTGKFIRGATTSGGSGGSNDAVVVAHTHQVSRIQTGSGYSAIIKHVGTLTGLDYQNTESTGVSGTDANMPEYYELIFIMRVS